MRPKTQSAYELARWWWLVAAAALLLAAYSAPALAGGISLANTSAAKLYHNHCSVCHGDKGDGKSRASGALSTVPRDFTSEASKRDLSRERIVLAITHGRPATAMMGWQSRLSPGHIDALADYILTQFVQRDTGTATPPMTAPSSSPRVNGVRDTAVSTIAAATFAAADGTIFGDTQEMKLGRKVYNFRCYFCHGYSGDAKTVASTYLTPPPRDFTSASPLSPRAILQVIRQGRSGTAMKSFTGILTEAEMQAVSIFVEREFVRDKARNTAYHTPENGWPDHQRFSAAFPYVTGAIGLDATAAALNADQQHGRSLFLSLCMSCHDRTPTTNQLPVWGAQQQSDRRGFGVRW